MKHAKSAVQPNPVEAARTRWLSASGQASTIAAELFQPGTGYGDPEARLQDEHRLYTARHEAERLFREYYDIAQRETEVKMLEIQRSLRLATWASFAVAAAVGIATLVSTALALSK